MRSLLLLLAFAAVCSADVTRPAYLGILEVRRGVFEITWRVPRVGDRVLAIGVRLPAVLHDRTGPSIGLEPTVQTMRWTAEAEPWELPGAVIEFGGLGRGRVDVMVRFESLDGAVVVRVLPPEVTQCRFPARAAPRGTARRIQAEVSAGLEAVAASLPYCAFLIALGLCGQKRFIANVLGLFLVGQLLGVAFGLPIPAPVARSMPAVAAAVVAAAAMRSDTRGLGAVAFACGFLHGPVLPGGAIGALGADAVGLITSLTVRAVLPARWTEGVGYLVGTGAIVLALAGSTGVDPAVERAPEDNVLLAPQGRSSESAGSSPVVAAADDPVQLFLEVTPFELRVECVAKLSALGVGDGKDVAVSEQPELKDRVRALFAEHVSLRVEVDPVTPAEVRVDFVTRDAGGVLERAEPVVETYDDAWIGIAASYPTPVTPLAIALDWNPLPDVESVPLVVVDPRKTRTASLDRAAPRFVWTGPVFTPPASAVEVREPALDLSVVSIALVVLAAFAAVRRFRRDGGTAARLLLTSACFAAPYLPVSIPLPGEGAPDDAQVKNVAETLLTNIYRGLEQPDANSAYDELRVSVTEGALRPIHLEQRRMLELGRRGGARARVDSVEVVRLELSGGDGIRGTLAWDAAGFVLHFGHRHFRQNRYEGEFELVVEDGSWKLGGLTVVGKERLR